jgi:hypothetical protein
MLLNKMVVVTNGTEDSRNKRQWKADPTHGSVGTAVSISEEKSYLQVAEPIILSQGFEFTECLLCEIVILKRPPRIVCIKVDQWKGYLWKL